nr:cell wall-binding repeat-containing protein [Mobiluncus porci]
MARQDVFADALASGTLQDGPTLLVPKSGTVPAEVLAAIKQLAPQKVMALGGTNAVSDQVLNEAAQGKETGRLAGQTRFATAVEISKHAFPYGGAKVVLADGIGRDGQGSPDAVAAGTIPGAAILLAPRQAGNDVSLVQAEIKRLGGNPVRLGGAGVFNPFQAANFPLNSALQGKTRYGTSVEIAKSWNPNPTKVYLARGDVFADAVASGCLTDGPVLLIARNDVIPTEVADFLKTVRPAAVVALGGNGAIPDAALQNAQRLSNGQDQIIPQPAKSAITGNGLPTQLRSISAGGDHTCAVADSGNVWCWGSNRFGQVGNGTASPNYGFDLKVDPLPENYTNFTGHNANVNQPVMLSLGNVVEVSSGLTHTCAYDAAGHAHCWGSNVTGQLGVGDTFSRTTPTMVPGLQGVTSISAAGETNGPWSIRQDRADWIPTGTGHTCAVANGSVFCWGDNKWGQLGDGSNTSAPTPVRVQGMNEPATKVVTGETTSCALSAAGNVYCWGTWRHDWGYGVDEGTATHGYGWLAGAPYADSKTARQVTSVSGATDLEAGSYYACAKTGATMTCWGYNSREQFFEDIDGNAMIPTGGSYPVSRRADTYAAAGWGTIQGFDLGRNSSCAIGPNSQVYCWGLNDAGQVGRPMAAGTNDASSDRLGIVGSIGTTVKDISVGWAHACAVTSDGGARCWGYNPDGQLGNAQTFGVRCSAWQTPRLGSLPFVARDPHVNDCQ